MQLPSEMTFYDVPFSNIRQYSPTQKYRIGRSVTNLLERFLYQLHTM